MAKTKKQFEQDKIIRQFRVAAAISLVVLTAGATFYHYVEDMKWLDAFYFCIVTLTTIGYGDKVPLTDVGKAFTILYIIIGVGIIAAFVNLFIKRAFIRHKHD